jgi:hypothetical protein
MDPWEDVKAGKELFGSYPAVKEFIVMPGIGHCPQVQSLC